MLIIYGIDILKFKKNRFKECIIFLFERITCLFFNLLFLYFLVMHNCHNTTVPHIPIMQTCTYERTCCNYLIPLRRAC